MRKTLFGMVIATAALLAALSAAPASAADLAGNPAAAPAVTAPSPLPANCGTGVVLPNQSAKAETCPVTPAAESTVPDFMTPPAKRLGYCHCGCVNQRVCRTSADCGGASCDQTISCC